MPGADPRAGSVFDPLAIECKFASLEPVRKRRASGAIFESVVLGRLEFVRMAPGRSSFWFGHQRMPDSRYTLQVVCEVIDDNTPGVDHVASVVTLRRNQVRDAAACLPLLNARLRELGMARTVREDDLVLTAIYLRAQPLLDPCHELEYHVAITPGLLVTVAFVYGVPLSVRVDQEA
jgi:hypothetical protein